VVLAVTIAAAVTLIAPPEVAFRPKIVLELMVDPATEDPQYIAAIGVLTPVPTFVVGELILEIVLLLMLAALAPWTSIALTEKPNPVLVLVIPLIVFPEMVFEVAPSGLT
jgi:hypothetical protein